MTAKFLDFIKKYKDKNPRRARIIRKAVRRGIKEYEETFKKLATS